MNNILILRTRLRTGFITGMASLIFAAMLSSCGQSTDDSISTTPKSLSNPVPVLVGKWITENDGSVMLDPQTSGLAVQGNLLLSLSDGSAHETQQRRIHTLDPSTATLAPKPNEMSMARRVRNSCFAQYLLNKPDLEALVVDPDDESVFYIVTEDATRTGAMSTRCQKQFQNTGSTDYPTLLVRVKQTSDATAVMTHVRPIQYAAEAEIGNFPNDGIEGLAITQDKTLYLGLEKDKEGKARVFSIELSNDFWQQSDFAKVAEPSIQMPPYFGGNHPINGLTWVASKQDAHPGYLLAAARNDNEIWVLDLSSQKPAKQILVSFAAPTNDEAECGETEIMDNASIEGLAVIGDTLYMVNDPWKRNYLKNVQCAANKSRYEAMAPLLFSMPMKADWFE